MLTFSEEQWRALQACDGRQFMATVCDQFLANRPDLAAAPGRSAILERITQAHDAYFTPSWTAISREGGRAIHAKLDTDFTATWTAISRQAGQ